MTSALIRAVLAGAIALSLPGSALAQPASGDMRADLAARVRGAQGVLVGTVVGVRARVQKNEWGDVLIVSRLSVAVDEVLKGSAASRITDVDVEGGTLNGVTLHVAHQPALDRGDRAALIVDAGPAGAWVPHQKSRGVLKLDASSRIVGTSLGLTDLRDAARAARQ